MTERDSIEYDVVIVGGGPAGLATAIRLKQRAARTSRDLSVCIIEKAAEFGAHTLSGAVLDTRALDELIPDWSSAAGFESCDVQRDEFYFLRNDTSALRVPGLFVPPAMHNAGLRIISLGSLCRWLADKAAELDVDLFPGFAAAQLEYGEDGRVLGVITSDRGIAKDGNQKSGFEPGIVLRGGQTVLAEGARGHLGRQLTERFGLADDSDPQHYALGLKEIWEVPPEHHTPGRVIHGSGWPLSDATGGFFSYHDDNGRVSVGLIVDLNYSNPSVSPFREFQRLKHHPLFYDTLKDGKRISYGARAITKGGLNSLGNLTVPGAVLVGCDAGTLNFAKIKGIHTAMKSGMVAADAIFDAGHEQFAGGNLESYREQLLASWVGEELRAARNVQPALHRFGPFVGGAVLFFDQNLMRGRAPWTLRDRVADHDAIQPATDALSIEYPSPDGVVSFDRLSSVYLSGTNHEEDQPSHLTLKDESVAIDTNLRKYSSPEQHYCPAGVYEIIENAGVARLQINAQNCVHCKACDIKDPTQNIVWVPPEDGGPTYVNM